MLWPWSTTSRHIHTVTFDAFHQVLESMFSLAEIATYNGMEIIRKRSAMGGRRPSVMLGHAVTFKLSLISSEDGPTSQRPFSRGQIEYVKEVRLSWRLLGWWYEKLLKLLLQVSWNSEVFFGIFWDQKLFWYPVDPAAGQKDQMSCCFCRCCSFSWPSPPWGSCALASKTVWWKVYGIAMNCCLLNWDEFRILHCLILLVSSCRILTLQ